MRRNDRRLVGWPVSSLVGPELWFVVQEQHQSADRAEAAPPRTKLERTRRNLIQEADTLAHTEQALRAEADKLTSDEAADL